ncbi:MAG: hypothetical protein JXR96_02930 [Deltaproteobacteria bacterium]|nr:hypothetical protein [Deltaproteobacteria bacterium]
MITRGITATVIAMCLIVGSVSAEDKIEKLSSDQTQAQYTRKSMTYVGIGIASGVRILPEALPLVEQGIRPGIELKRFDYNQVDINAFGSIEAFVEALRDYVKKRASDRAAAEAEYEDRFKSARVYAKDVDRIMSSAYLYDIRVNDHSVQPIICYDEVRTNKQGKKVRKEICRPGSPTSPKHRPKMEAKLDLSVTFYHANLTDPNKKPYSLLKELRKHNTDSVSYPGMPRRPKVSSPEAQRAYQARLEEYRRNLPAMQRDAGLQATGGAARGLQAIISKEMKQIPDFQLKTPVQTALSDGVEFMLGQAEGLGLDDTYDVTEFDAAGTKSLIGYVKVRKIGDATGSGGGTPSYAEKVKEKRDFVGGEQLYEHPMIGINFGIHPVFEFTVKDILKDSDTDEVGLYFGGGIHVDWDIANMVHWPEFYLTLDGDFLYLGDYGTESAFLTHWLLGAMKKFYIESLVIAIGLRGGIDYFVVGDDDSGDTLIGGGADLVLGLEYYVSPEFSAYLNLAGRFFTNPLSFTGADANFEMGAHAQLGIRLGV